VAENPNGPLRLFIGYPTTSRTDALFIFDINTEGGNPFLGSGQLDGNGVPPDFFSNVHVRKAFNYCFDWDSYIQEALIGEAVQNYGVIIPGMLGYNPDGPHYSFDLEQCQAEIEQAWDGAVAENGFRLQVAFNTGNVTRQTIAQILQTNFRQIDPKYNIEIIGLPWPSFLNAVLASRLPISVSSWIEDIHDPHNWAQPFTVGIYADRQMFPDELRDQFQEYVSVGVATTDNIERQLIYEGLNQLDYDEAPAIRLAVNIDRHYEQRWVDGWYFNPIYSSPYNYYYAMSKR
jgi:peptide/nickel transport system substrate-binding protein